MIKRANRKDAGILAGLAIRMWTDHDPEELAEEFRAYAHQGGLVLVSTHSPDFLNAIELEELFYLVKDGGYTTICRAKDDKQVSAYMADGDKLGRIWKDGLFRGVDPQ